jgi:hypothetical protein
MRELEYLPAISALPAISVRYFHWIGRESDRFGAIGKMDSHGGV